MQSAQVVSINVEKEERSQRGAIRRIESDCQALIDSRKLIEEAMMKVANISGINATYLSDARANIVEAYGENKTLINIYKAGNK